MTKHSSEFTLFGQEFKVTVKEKADERAVRVIDAEAQRTKGHSYVIHRDEREASDGGLLSDGEELPPRGEHVAKATHEGIQKWLRYESKERSFEQQVEQAIESTVEIWEQNFERAEDFK